MIKAGFSIEKILSFPAFSFSKEYQGVQLYHVPHQEDELLVLRPDLGNGPLLVVAGGNVGVRVEK
ncbi:MAG: hypothetical protein JRJ47_11995 [Deltaproteobacteria bacterium]|nr:hypothetical protein [Deltaproteobacteria bacterium]